MNGNFDKNTTIAKAISTTGLSFLTLAGSTDYQTIKFNTTSISNPSYDATTSLYTVPSTGIYEITFYIRYGKGVTTSLLTDKKVAIMKTTGTTTTPLNERNFDGVNLDVDILGVGSGLLSGIASITLSSSTINSVYALNQNDVISFAISTGLELGLINDSKAEFVIKKISN